MNTSSLLTRCCHPSFVETFLKAKQFVHVNARGENTMHTTTYQWWFSHLWIYNIRNMYSSNCKKNFKVRFICSVIQMYSLEQVHLDIDFKHLWQQNPCETKHVPYNNTKRKTNGVAQRDIQTTQCREWLFKCRTGHAIRFAITWHGFVF